MRNCNAPVTAGRVSPLRAAPCYRLARRGLTPPLTLTPLREIPTLPIAQEAVRLAEPAAFGHKLVRRGGIKLEQIEVAGNHTPRANGVGQLRGLAPIEIAGDAPFGAVTIDGQKCDINGEAAERRHQCLMPERIAAMVKGQPTPTY